MINDESSKRAWIETKLSYFKQKGIFTRKDLMSYREYWVRRFYLHNYIAKKTDGTMKKLFEDDELFDEVRAHKDKQEEFYKEKVEKFLPDTCKIDDLKDCSAYLFKLDNL